MELSTRALGRDALGQHEITSMAQVPTLQTLLSLDPLPARVNYGGISILVGSGFKSTLGRTHLEDGHSCATAGSLDVFEEVGLILKRDSHTGEHCHILSGRNTVTSCQCLPSGAHNEL